MAPADTTIPPITLAYTPQTEPSLVLSQPQIQSTTSCIHSPIATASASLIASSPIHCLFHTYIASSVGNTYYTSLHILCRTYSTYSQVTTGGLGAIFYTRHSGRESGTDKQLCRRDHGCQCICILESYTCEDVRAFMGFNILMGINRQPSTEDYWKKDPIPYYKPIAQRISRDRFRDISRYLHFVGNSTLSLRGSANYDKLGKVRPLIKHFQERFSSLYNPNC